MKNGYDHMCFTAYNRMNSFIRNQKGGPDDSAGVVFKIFVGILLLVGVYILLKDLIDNFVKEKIFGKMNSLD